MCRLCNLEHIKNLCEKENLRWTMHMMTRLLQRGISLDNVTQALEVVKLLNNIPMITLIRVA